MRWTLFSPVSRSLNLIPRPSVAASSVKPFSPLKNDKWKMENDKWKMTSVEG
jgi:hypothetical protein